LQIASSHGIATASVWRGRWLVKETEHSGTGSYQTAQYAGNDCRRLNAKQSLKEEV